MNVVVHDELLWEIHQWRREGAENEDVIARLRPRQFPKDLLLIIGHLVGFILLYLMIVLFRKDRDSY